MRTRIYFDTNVYNFISLLSETTEVCSFLKKNNLDVKASSENLMEMHQIVDYSEKKDKIISLLKIANQYETFPQSYLQVNEVRREIHRCRKEWLKDIVLLKQTKKLLKQNIERWNQLKSLKIPKYEDENYKQFHTDFNSGIKSSVTFQKTVRAELLKGNALTLIDNSDEQNIELIPNLTSAEEWWRVTNLSAWYGAIVLRNPSSSDYRDWLTPYLRENAFTSKNYNKFWLEDVVDENVPRNRLIGLIDYYQTKYRITSGNPLDQLHACHIFDVNYFFTADKNFYKILKEVIESHYPAVKSPILIDRNSNSVFQQISSKLTSHARPCL